MQANVRNYYMQFEETQTQSAIDDKIMSFVQHARPAMPLVRPAQLAKTVQMLQLLRAAGFLTLPSYKSTVVDTVPNLLCWATCSRALARQCRWGTGRQWACHLQEWACARPWACHQVCSPLHFQTT